MNFSYYFDCMDFSKCPEDRKQPAHQAGSYAEPSIVEVLSPERYCPTHQSLHVFFIHSLETLPKALRWDTGKGFKIHCNPEEKGMRSMRKWGVLCSPLS